MQSRVLRNGDVTLLQISVWLNYDALRTSAIVSAFIVTLSMLSMNFNNDSHMRYN